MSHCLRLAEISIGEHGRVSEILGGISLRHRLGAIGIRPGVVIEKVAGSPSGGPVVVGIGHIRLAVGHGMAGKIMVEVERASES